MNVIIETDRLLLRHFIAEDAPLLYELNPDPEVICYTPDPIKRYRPCKASVGTGHTTAICVI